LEETYKFNSRIDICGNSIKEETPPPREMLEAKLHEAIRLARGQVERGTES